MFNNCGVRRGTSINRNIVECKARYGDAAGDFSPVLIETLWNVKEQTTSTSFKRNSVLIETLWNVKLVT